MRSTFQRFVQSEAAGGVVLFIAAILALGWANSPWAHSYTELLEFVVPVGAGEWRLEKSVHHWINDGLMVVFFLLVGLEIKREMLIGELSSPRKALLPVGAALGGMLVPALIYITLNPGGAFASGWGIPMATDIAFALGVLALLGSRAPLGLKVFLAALAIADDLGAVIVIALFYGSDLSPIHLIYAGGILALLATLNIANVRYLVVYLAVGVLLWLAVLSSGLHATIAGVALAFAIPARTRGQPTIDGGPLTRLEHLLNRPVAFFIMPVFAFANAGLALGGASMSTASVALGVGLGLLIGKPVGITLFSWLASRYFGASLPDNVNIRSVFAVSWTAGIGFTMALFVATLALPGADALASAKLGIFGGSAVAGVIGYVLLRRTLPPRNS